jgi:hypothetical protein
VAQEHLHSDSLPSEDSACPFMGLVKREMMEHPIPATAT